MPQEYDISNIAFLIADDNMHTRSMIKNMLSGFGVWNVIGVSDAVEAMEALRTRAVDVIIVGQHMEKLDVNKFVQLMRTAKDSPNPFIPIIMLTSSTQLSQITRARDVGVTEFLAKPICARDLYLRVVQSLDRPREFIHSPEFSGPDRRRSPRDGFEANDRRKKHS